MNALLGKKIFYFTFPFNLFPMDKRINGSQYRTELTLFNPEISLSCLSVKYETPASSWISYGTQTRGHS